MTMREWRLPAALILLGLIPMLAGAGRLTELGTGPQVTPENARFVADPLPVVLHIVGAVVYTVLGAFQFVPRLRRHRWHRRAGRVLVPCGLTVAFSGMWMAVGYDLPAHDNDVLAGMRLVFGSVMAGAILLGLAAVLRRDIDRHRRWMVRGYAIGLGAGTQAFTHAPYLIAVGEQPDGNLRAGLVVAGWLINLAVAEWYLRRPARAVTAPALTLS
ncbi:DUF2306 domain-containing protein [Micromonospora sp. M51]|uniref:DUF2306 domain-containing protein n=1 Tax=Micromonospora TaxID=1873 RepID=UPI001B366644|nr:MULTISPECIES: DUF2306 domain-containing protein [unclassified Micromonospora]MBQ1009648.1 DUF2306 domain-containing protein [Micromonospora sp. M51]MBQ1028705.1 DUF2306 domain-containing protein [Micromonospora sp. C97]